MMATVKSDPSPAPTPRNPERKKKLNCNFCAFFQPHLQCWIWQLFWDARARPSFSSCASQWSRRHSGSVSRSPPPGIGSPHSGRSAAPQSRWGWCSRPEKEDIVPSVNIDIDIVSSPSVNIDWTWPTSNSSNWSISTAQIIVPVRPFPPLQWRATTLKRGASIKNRLTCF